MLRPRAVRLLLHVLIVTATAGYRHESIPAAEQVLAKRFGWGRVLYTALGHREDVWQSEWFRAHLSGIVQWAVEAPSTPPKRRAVRH